MNVKQLKEMIKGLPDDALVLVQGGHGSVIEANVQTGFATEPNNMGYINFMDEEFDESYVHRAVYFSKPM